MGLPAGGHFHNNGEPIHVSHVHEGSGSPHPTTDAENFYSGGAYRAPMSPREASPERIVEAPTPIFANRSTAERSSGNYGLERNLDNSNGIPGFTAGTPQMHRSAQAGMGRPTSEDVVNASNLQLAAGVPVNKVKRAIPWPKDPN